MASEGTKKSSTPAKKSSGTQKSSSTTKKSSGRRQASSGGSGSGSGSGGSGGSGSGSGSRKRASAPRTEAPRRMSASEVAAAAARQLLALSGHEAEGVTGLARTEDGWTVQIDVVELRRIPSTTDLLATYEVQVDESGELLGYRRLHRYTRGGTREDQ